MLQDCRNCFILTGGPGAGKTTLLEHLAGEGISVMPEAGRGIIRSQMALGGRALPWEDRVLFAELMLGWELRSLSEAATQPGPILFDRGIPDVLGYLTLEGLAAASHMQRAAQGYRYNPTVFLAPPWEEIFHTDAERRQDFDTACRTYEVMRRVYADLGYNLVELPRGPVGVRAEFIRTYLPG